VITFPRVPEVESGDPVTSAQLAGLADAINARILSGLGDGAWRIAYYWHAIGRQFRTMGATDGEFFHSMQMLDTPLTLPLVGSIGGVSTSNPVGLYVHGAGSFPSETDAYNVPMAEVGDAESAWSLAKSQRGAFNPETEEWASPSFDAARHAFRIVYAGTSIFGNAYGGWAPTPESLGTCTDPDASPNFEIFFTNVETGATTTFDGTCPNEPTHIAGIWQTPLAYWVSLNDGALYYFDRSKWIEGPYSAGNALRKSYGEHLPRILNSFAGEFRGDASRVELENAGKAQWLGKAFDIRQFLTRPYYLAPARGYTINNEVVPQYTTGSRSGPTVSGRIGSHTAQAGCWFSSAIVRLTGTIQTATVQFLSDGVVIGSATVSGPNGAALALFDDGAQSITVSVSSVSGTSVTVSYEIAETYAYRPGVHDLWALLRLAGANSAADIDGSGRSTANANEIWQAYIGFGVIPKLTRDTELTAMDDRQIDTNAVFDKFRRASRVVRLLHPTQVAGYAVEDGNSILYVRPRFQSIVGNPEADTLAGIRDAIVNEAEPGEYTNEWCAFPRFAAYHPSPTSDWSEDGYANYWSTSDRCAFYASPFTSIQLRRHLNANTPDAVNLFLAPENATGYRYTANLNTFAPAAEFYKSCRLYEPPLKILSAETVTISGEEQVKITFDGRLHHHETAPASIDRDIASWDLTALETEQISYRTDENAIRAYLAWRRDTSGANCEPTGPGNAASGSSVQFLPDNPFGSCFPHIWLVQLLPKPRHDDNDRSDAEDTPVRHDIMLQAETYIRAMCEGFVDGKTSVDYGCATGVSAIFDYTFANLCFDAFGGTSITTIPTEETEALGPDEVRTDSPIGYGPLPTIRLSAEQWNQYAKAVNKLTRVRVALPYELEVQSYTDGENSVRYVGAVRSYNGATADCSVLDLVDGWRSEFDGGGTSPETLTTTWTPQTVVSAANTVRYSVDATYVCSSGSGPLFEVSNSVQEDEYRFSLVDPDAENAIPSTWRDMISLTGEMLWTRQHLEVRERHTVVALADGTECGGLKAWQVGASNAWQIEVYGNDFDSCELLPTTGRLTIPTIGTAVLYGAQAGLTRCSNQLSVADNYEPVTSDALILRVPFDDEEQT
jgi:hypothetical protein